MNKGAVWLRRNGKIRRIRRATSPLQAGDVVTIHYSERILDTLPPEPVLIEDRETYSIWHKPAGLMSSGTRYGDHCAINRWIEKSWQRPVFLVHRLDRFASGLMVLAHSKQAAALLSGQFHQRTTKKVYKAVVEGSVPHSFTMTEPLDDREAISHISPLDTNGEQTLVLVAIETGRKHQIRRHLADAGFPVSGDSRYGRRRATGLQLAAVELGFHRPEDEVWFTWKLPDRLHPALPEGQSAP